MPTVATTAPATPATKNPMKVATVKTGPGVAWLMAIASISWRSDSQWDVWTTSL